MTDTLPKEESDIPVDSYRVIRSGVCDYWLQRWTGYRWWPVWPYFTRWGAIWGAKQKIAERDAERTRVEQTVWEESH